MSNIWYDYRNFKIAIIKTYESTEDRIARGSVDAAVVGYYFYIWQRPEQGQGLRQVLTTVDYPTETEAVAKAQEAIDLWASMHEAKNNQVCEAMGVSGIPERNTRGSAAKTGSIKQSSFLSNDLQGNS